MLGFKQQPGVKHKDVYLMVFYATKKSRSNGEISFTLACGNKYIMVAVELDGNYIDGKQLRHGQKNHLPKLIKPFFSVGRRLESSARTGTYSITKHQRS